MFTNRQSVFGNVISSLLGLAVGTCRIGEREQGDDPPEIGTDGHGQTAEPLNRMRTSDSYLPATFEERGVAVSFTTPALAYARIRKDYRDRLEVVLPNIGESKGTFVIPWSALADTVTLTTHDRALQEEVQNSDAVSPYDIRTA